MSRSMRDSGFYVRLGWLLTLLGFGGFMLWASLAPLDQGVTVPGTVVVSGKRKAVQSMAAGGGGRGQSHPGQRRAGGAPRRAAAASGPDPGAGRCRGLAGPVPHGPGQPGAVARRA